MNKIRNVVQKVKADKELIRRPLEFFRYERKNRGDILRLTPQCQRGRSMIEMLGVLAIIGVLSVGGIMGYSKAMFRYKINKTIEQVTYIAGNVRTTFASQGNYDDLSCWYYSGHLGGNCQIVKKAKILPDEMVATDSNGNLTSISTAWGEGLSLYGGNSCPNDRHCKYFRIHFEKMPIDMCIELAVHDWSSANVKGIFINGNVDVYTPKPMLTLDEALYACQNDGEEYMTDFELFFDDISDNFE